MAVGEIPGLHVKITADTTGLNTKLQTSSSQLDQFRTKVNDASVKLIKFGAAATIAGGALAGMKLVSVTREFNKLSAGLITATGSAEGAERAFAAIQDFAATTPSTLQDVTDAFIKLNNLGLGPSERALTSYGDTASAMGKDLMQFIEAVADASTAEFERLKEFGIRAKNQGDTIAFTFKGVTTTVANNAAAIEEHLIRLGEVNFAGAMQRRMETLDGALSNLGDSWDKLFLTVSNAGIGSIIEDAARLGIKALDELSAEIESGQLPAQLEAIGSKFDAFGQDFAELFATIGDIAEDEFRFIADVGDNTAQLLSSSFKDFPENMRAIVQLAGVEVGALGGVFAASAEFAVQAYTVKLASLVDKAGVIGEAIAKGLNPLNATSEILAGVEAEFARIDIIAQETTDGFAAALEAQVAASIGARQDSIVAIMTERDAALKSFDDQMAAADALRAKFDEANQARLAAGGDRLAEFGGSAGGGDAGGMSDGAKQKLSDKLDAIRESYLAEQELLREKVEVEAEILTAALDGELITKAEYEALGLQQKAAHEAALTDIEQKESEARKNIAKAEADAKKAAFNQMFTDLASLMNSGSRKMFEIGKAAAIAQTTMSTIESAGHSYNFGSKIGGPPLGAAFAAAAVASGVARVQQISSTSFGSKSAAIGGGGMSAPSAAPTSAEQGAAGGSNRIINVTGISLDSLINGRMLVDIFNQAQEDGARLVIQ
jgi:hypothetical protein